MNRFTKGLVSTVLSLAIAGGMVFASLAADFRYGDLDKSGTVNSSDALIALNHAVGKTVLTGDDFKAADVNGDKSVNSTDALDILSFSIGLIKKFAVEAPAVPSLTDNEILALYATAVSKARKERPSYKIVASAKTTDADVKVNDPMGLLGLAGSSAAEMEKQMKDEMLADNNSDYNNIHKQGSTNSFEDLPEECMLKDATALKSIKLDVLQNGNYKIEIYFNDEKNPKAGSTLCKAMGVIDYDQMLKKLEDEATVEGVGAKIALNELSYKNCWIKCEINPATGEFVSIDNNSEVTIKNTMTMIVKVDTSMSMATTKSHSNFGY